MLFKQLGNTGLQVSAVGLGCNNFGMRCDIAQTKEVVAAALDHGITFFDTADVYGNRGLSESYLGESLGSRRQDIVLATKFGMPMGDDTLSAGGSRRYVYKAVEASLKRLKTDYIDLYQLHFPDPRTPILETLSALDELVKAGKVRYIGCSNMTGWQLADAQWTAKAHGLNQFATAQNHYSLVDRRIEDDLLQAAAHFNVGVLPYFPLASGLLTGKYRRGEEPQADTRLANAGPRGAAALSDRNFDLLDRLSEFADERDKTLLDLAISYLASNPNVSSVIAGATKPHQIAANVNAGQWQLTEAERQEVASIKR